MQIPKSSFVNQVVGVGFVLLGLPILALGGYAAYEVIKELLTLRVFPFLLVGAFLFLCALWRFLVDQWGTHLIE